MNKIFRKMTASVLSLCMAGALVPAAAIAAGTVSVYVNGQKLDFDVNPIIENDRTLVPMRYIFEALGAQVEWDPAVNTATGTKNENTIQITINSNILIKNGLAVTLDAPARLIDGRTLVPVRAVSEGLGANVDWDAQENRVLISLQDNYAKMTDEQKAMLKAREEEIRGNFVNQSFPNGVLTEYPEIGAEIKQKSQTALDYIKERWTVTALDEILDIKRMSDPDFMTPEGEKIGDITDKFFVTVKEAGLDPANYMDTAFVDLDGGRVMMLLNFKTTSHQYSGKYIGVVAMSDEEVRCFIGQPSTAEEKLFFGEALGDLKVHNIGYCGWELSDFIQAVNDTLKNA